MEAFMNLLGKVNGVIWHNYVLYIVLAVAVLFTLWSIWGGICQYRALTHGVQVVRGKYDDKNDPGAINHFQALSAALSATVGLGNIGGVALAIALGGPGAVFWMWVIGLAGMALKTTEVTLSMIYRNTDDPDNPHGGPMYVADKGFKKMGLGAVGKIVGGIFVVTLLISTITGGNMFQAWNVGVVTETNFQIPQQVVGVILAVTVGAVILGGIKRIGAVAGRLVPLMCALYLLAAAWVIILDIDQIPAMLGLIIKSAFNPIEADHAFLGGTAGYAFLWGMKRALFSSEAGQGSSPIAHSAAKTDEPVREGVVAGLEPFVDTIVVCTLTTLVVLLSGAYNRGPESHFDAHPKIINATQVVVNNIEKPVVGQIIKNDGSVVGVLKADPKITEAPYQEFPLADVKAIETIEQRWIVDQGIVPPRTSEAKRIVGTDWRDKETVFMILSGTEDPNTGRTLRRLSGTVREIDGTMMIAWKPWPDAKDVKDLPKDFEGPTIAETGLYNDLVGAALTSHAFDRVTPGLGKWLVTIASWLFAISTMISWSYYGENGMVWLLGKKSIMPYRLIYCGLILVACAGFIRTDTELDELTALGTGVMLWANIPIMLIFGAIAMRYYKNYFDRIKAGGDPPHAAQSILDLAEGKDVQ